MRSGYLLGPTGVVRRLLTVGLVLGGLQAGAQPAPNRVVGISGQLEQIVIQLKNAEDNLRVVDTQYTERVELSVEQALLRRYSDGELQYLLGDFAGASVLFYDLVGDRGFRGNARYDDAVYYLADSLYQQGNLVGAKLYLRQVLAQPGAHYRDALSRYIEVAGKSGDFAGIDGYIAQARGPDGQLPLDLAYVYGKWTFRRQDLSREERAARAREIFTPIANQPAAKSRLSAAYFIAVSWVQVGDYAKAAEAFQAILAETPEAAADKKVQELAILSLGRVLYEIGKFDEAIDTYQGIPRDSDSFIDSLYEIAWSYVKKGELEKAKDATDILILVGPDSTVAPDALILQGHLLLKLGRYAEAMDTYTGVINSYAPVRDEIDALLSVNKDPVAYFDNLLARNERNLDVAALLPPVALKWATTQREVSEAVALVSDLEAGRRGVVEGQEVATRLLKALDERGAESFPAVQEGYTRADAVDTALTQADEQLTALEHRVVQQHLSAEQLAELDRLRGEQSELTARFASLPRNLADVDARKKRLRDRVDEMDKSAFRLSFEIQEMDSIVAAMQQWADDTRTQRKNSSEDERAFAQRLARESEDLAGMRREIELVRKDLATERTTAEAVIGGEDAIRTRYQELLARQQEILKSAAGKYTSEEQTLLVRIGQVRQQGAELRGRVVASKQFLRSQLAERGAHIREKILTEQALLTGYSSSVTAVSSDARQLVGRIAFDSFKRVRQQFYELVLKADVGVVDVAFTRKQDKTSQIQTLSAQKDRELRALDEEFKEVLKDVD